MRIIGIIPARMAASRFPGKPMASILGIPMIGHCYLRSKLCDLIDDVYVATCDAEIYEYIKNIGGKAVMTADVHERATERTAEALLNIEASDKDIRYDIVVMIQGDEPLVDPNMLREAATPLINGDKMVSNLIAALLTQEERDNPNNVKIVTAVSGNILYMSREAIPSKHKYNGSIKTYRQLGLIAFTRGALLEFVSLPTTPLEIIESVDMNRFLEHDIPIYSVITRHDADSVDTPEDLARVKEKMKTDKLFQSYKNHAQ